MGKSFSEFERGKFKYNVLVTILAKENCVNVINAIEKRMMLGSQGRIGYCLKTQGFSELGRLDEANKGKYLWIEHLVEDSTVNDALNFF